MPNERIELVSSQDSPTGVAGRRVDGEFTENQGVVVNQPESAVPAVLSSGQLQDQQDFDLSGVNIQGTQVDGELSRFESQADQTEKSLADRTQEGAEQQRGTAFTSIGDYINTALGQATESELREAAETQATVGGKSVDDLKVEVNDYNNQIRAEQHALRRTIENLERNPLGGTREQVQGLIENKKRESLRKQADLAILQQTALGKFDIAKDIADRAIDAQLERQQLVLDTKKFVAEKNWDLFTVAEQRAFQTQLAEEEREIEAERAEMKLLEDTKLSLLMSASSQNAPSGVQKAIQNADSPESAIMAAGEYAGDKLARQIKLSQLHGQQLSNQVTQSKIDSANQAVDEGKYTPEQAEVINGLTKQLRGEKGYQEMFEVRAGYNTAKVGYKQQSGFGDIAMVNGYQRMIDPGATVRGEDIKTQQEAVAYVQSVLNIKGQVMRGDKFTPEVRKLLNNAVDAQFTQRVEDFETTTMSRYETVLERNPTLSGLDVSFSDIGDTFDASLGEATKDPVTNNDEVKMGDVIIGGDGKQYRKVGDNDYELVE